MFEVIVAGSIAAGMIAALIFSKPSGNRRINSGSRGLRIVTRQEQVEKKSEDQND